VVVVARLGNGEVEERGYCACRRDGRGWEMVNDG